ncbi:hypothetical protein AVEN_27549-1 [Araneus ventricosus]|uniref:Uncharacterized protein n=1 Tax=Araneus ventricosus TaxID=182803 RepID=A0A4Y2TQ38_ARAVE|nr:hypothetical protein AVEN_27549-1 [Araneus ventricosus]
MRKAKVEAAANESCENRSSSVSNFKQKKGCFHRLRAPRCSVRKFWSLGVGRLYAALIRLASVVVCDDKSFMTGRLKEGSDFGMRRSGLKPIAPRSIAGMGPTCTLNAVWGSNALSACDTSELRLGL